ncbi:O-linked N-acetylglucosamine transferase, SPINDLY family protein [Aquicella siphonis]|nr:hypothetical protein [Aquicella siphonis]
MTLKLANFFSQCGLPDLAAYAYEAYLTFEKNDPNLHIYLQTLMYTSPDIFDHKYIFDAHTKWGKTLVRTPKYMDYPNALTSDRKLKIGYTCHFVTNSTSSTLLLPILKSHNRNKVEIFMYSDQDASQTPDNIRKYAEHWRDTQHLNDDDFCDLIRSDQIDILLELNGHCATNRYRALTRKPAPIQISYYNYSSTSGVPEIDYILVGEEVGIDNLQPYYSETIYHKKGIIIATPISDHFPPVSPPPFLKNGYITFGSFGQAHKVSHKQIQLWCEVLKKVSNSRFYMKANALDCEVVRSVFMNHFINSGIDSHRIILEGGSDYETLLNCYSKLDITLDTYPFGGGTTPIESIIQGVPVITLVGERFCSWHGYNNMHNIGHDEFIAQSSEEFVNKAVNLANDKNKLADYRRTLRSSLANSPRGDMKRFINELEEAYTDMWNTYIESVKTSM